MMQKRWSKSWLLAGILSAVMMMTLITPAMAVPADRVAEQAQAKSDGGRGDGPPPGLAKKDQLPPGLRGREALPPGLAKAKGDVVEIQLIQYSDWHGQIDTLSVFGEGDFGSAAALSTYFDMERAQNPNTIVITGGDDFGASPPISNLFDETPAVLSQNLMGLDVSALGNHNFDRGTAFLATKVAEADYSYVAANLTNLGANGLSAVKPYEIFDFGEIQVAVIGVTNEEAPTVTFPGSFGSIVITDAATAAMQAKADATTEGADVFVLIGHDGVRSVDANGSASGELIDLANQVSGFDAVLGDHTDVEFSSRINGAVVVENRSKGRTYSRISFTVDTFSDDVISSSVTFIDPFTAGVTPDPAIVAMLAPYRVSLAEQLDGVIATTTGLFRRGGNYERLGESPAGDLMADSFVARYGTQLALTNSGGIRSSIPSSYIPADPAVDRDGIYPDDVVLGDIIAFHTFGNEVLTRTVTGTQLWAALEHGLGDLPGAAGKFPAIAGFRVIYDSAAATGSKVISVSLLDGTPILANATTYTIAVNNFINAGGDGYTMLADGQGTSQELVTDVVTVFVENQGTITPTFDCRLVDVNPTGPAADRQNCSAFLP